MLHLINKPINISAGEQVDIFTWLDEKRLVLQFKACLPPNEFTNIYNKSKLLVFIVLFFFLRTVNMRSWPEHIMQAVVKVKCGVVNLLPGAWRALINTTYLFCLCSW